MRKARSLASLGIALVFAACNTGGGAQTTAPATTTPAPATAAATTPVATTAAATTPAATDTAAPSTPAATDSPAATTPAATDSPAATSPAASATPAASSPAGSPGNAADFKACEVSDTGGISDKGFNQNAYKGLEDAKAELGVGEIKFLESTADADYGRNIQTFIDEECDIIVTVGFLLGDATQKAAQANKEQKFAIVDYAYEPAEPNVLGIVFAMDEPSMLAGYLAAGMSKTGTVATFGGIKIPPVTAFMDGFQAGVNYYNKQKGKQVQLLGWDAAAQTGSFTGDFSDTAKGRQLAEGFMQQNADVIFAVAGPVGLGAMAAVQDANKSAAEGEKTMFIGVDVDQTQTAPEYKDILVSSVLKRIDNGVKAAVQAAVDGTFQGGVSVNTLANEGTGLAPYNEFQDDVDAALDAEIKALQAEIIAGTVKPADWYKGAPAGE